MHAARAMNAQRKRREEKLQAQQRRPSAVSMRSTSRSPIPSMDIEGGDKKRGKPVSKRVDFAYVGFILAIFGAVPLLVGTFISVPGLWEVGLGLTLVGLVVGIVFWCCDFCVHQATPPKPNKALGSQPPRKAHGGKVQDISTVTLKLEEPSYNPEPPATPKVEKKPIEVQIFQPPSKLSPVKTFRNLPIGIPRARADSIPDVHRPFVPNPAIKTSWTSRPPVPRNKLPGRVFNFNPDTATSTVYEKKLYAPSGLKSQHILPPVELIEKEAWDRSNYPGGHMPVHRGIPKKLATPNVGVGLASLLGETKPLQTAEHLEDLNVPAADNSTNVNLSDTEAATDEDLNASDVETTNIEGPGHLEDLNVPENPETVNLSDTEEATAEDLNASDAGTATTGGQDLDNIETTTAESSSSPHLDDLEDIANIPVRPIQSGDETSTNPIEISRNDERSEQIRTIELNEIIQAVVDMGSPLDIDEAIAEITASPTQDEDDKQRLRSVDTFVSIKEPSSMFTLNMAAESIAENITILQSDPYLKLSPEPIMELEPSGSIKEG